ncbi:metal ABC transporter substrate-binding protein [Pseudobutyrivibrio ruminis]|uniref:metal ABC transporter substrate-binding protein n=1 Tax=Pseudobutyrivibrio ruminis TaxID=46206 RepID=UPI00051B74CE|nr:metal ABC transporter substrate-binding protein [Pseudobutyrivibrio ruminis]
MKTNKIIAFLAATTLGVSAFTGCGASTDNNSSVDNTNSDNTISVVTTIFPEYDWVREIVGDNDNVEITMLLDNGVDLHNYQPTADDIMKIATCDVFVYVGGESDEWVEDALSEATNKDMQVVNLLESLGESVKEEEVVEGMMAEEETEAEEGEEEEVEYDEHVWLSLKNAQVLVDAIEQAIATVDADNADTYAANASAYNAELATLDEKYQATIDEASVKTVLFGDRFPFRYLVDDYGLDYYAAFVGCSAETEASFETITFLAGKVDELNLNTVFTIENSDQKIAQTIIENTSANDAQILALDSMQSTTSDDVAAGVTYLSVMEGNLDVLSQGLK